MEFLKDKIIGEPKQYKTQLAGFDYCQLELEYAYKKSGNIDNAIVSDNIKEVHEKDNPHDVNAIAIYLFNVKIGYIPASDNVFLKGLKHRRNTFVRLYHHNDKYKAEFSTQYR